MSGGDPMCGEREMSSDGRPLRSAGSGEEWETGPGESGQAEPTPRRRPLRMYRSMTQEEPRGFGGFFHEPDGR